MPPMPASYRSFLVWLQQAKAQGKSGTGAGVTIAGVPIPPVVVEPIVYLFRMFGAGYVAPTSDALLGGTVSQTTPEAQPVVTSSGAAFDGINDRIVATFTTPIDLKGHVVFAVFTPKTMTSNNNTLFSFLTNLGATSLEVQARNTPNFQGRVRTSGFGTPSFVDLYGTRNETFTHTGKVLLTLHITSNRLFASVQDKAFGSMALSGGSQLVSQLRVGSDTADYAQMDLHEVSIVPSSSYQQIRAEAARLVADWGVVAPVLTNLLGTDCLSFGDSIAAGVATDQARGFLEQASTGLLTLTNKNFSTLAGAQFCPVGEADTTKASFAFSNITNGFSYPVGTSYILVHYGINDYVRARAPLGTVGGAANVTTVLGCMKTGINNIRAVYPNIKIVFTCPFYYNYGEGVNTAGYSLQQLRDGMEDVCGLDPNTFFVDMFSTLGIDAATQATYLADGSHPNDAGHTLAGQFLLSKLKDIL